MKMVIGCLEITCNQRLERTWKEPNYCIESPYPMPETPNTSGVLVQAVHSSRLRVGVLVTTISDLKGVPFYRSLRTKTDAGNSFFVPFC